MKRKLAVFLLILASASGAKADLMARGKITVVVNSTSAAGTFSVKVEGTGSYPCNGNPQAISAVNFSDQKSFDRAFSMALVAFSAGYTVEIYSGSGLPVSCGYLNYFQMLKD